MMRGNDGSSVKMFVFKIRKKFQREEMDYYMRAPAIQVLIQCVTGINPFHELSECVYHADHRPQRYFYVGYFFLVSSRR